MGHAHHFLSRLDRLDTEHLELALQLYRDAELLQSVLERARRYVQSQRFAVALDENGRDGPFVLLTLDGHFVTCLGVGMRPGAIVVPLNPRKRPPEQRRACVPWRRARSPSALSPKIKPMRGCWCGSPRKPSRCCESRHGHGWERAA